jgi:hypothetical protein
MSGPPAPPNAATSARLPAPAPLERIPVRTCVNRAAGAPQFAAIAALGLGGADATGHAFADGATLVTALPHDRGAWGGMLFGAPQRRADARGAALPRRVQCFATWTALDSYRNLLALASGRQSAGGNDSDDGGINERDGIDDDDEGGDGDAQDNRADGSDDSDGGRADGGSGDDGAAGGDAGGGGGEAGSRGGRKPQRKAVRRRKPKKHFAFRRQAERLPEAWFVLSPVESPTAAGDATRGGDVAPAAFDMLPLLEVFSFQALGRIEDRSQRLAEGKAPELYTLPGSRRRRA